MCSDAISRGQCAPFVRYLTGLGIQWQEQSDFYSLRKFPDSGLTYSWASTAREDFQWARLDCCWESEGGDCSGTRQMWAPRSPHPATSTEKWQGAWDQEGCAMWTMRHTWPWLGDPSCEALQGTWLGSSRCLHLLGQEGRVLSREAPETGAGWISLVVGGCRVLPWTLAEAAWRVERTGISCRAGLGKAVHWFSLQSRSSELVFLRVMQMGFYHTTSG